MLDAAEHHFSPEKKEDPALCSQSASQFVDLIERIPETKFTPPKMISKLYKTQDSVQ